MRTLTISPRLSTVTALLVTSGLAVSNSGCVLWALHARNQSLEEAQQRAAVTQGEQNKCQAKVDQQSPVPDAPPEAALNGTWQCLYTSPLGEQFAENVTFMTSGRRVSITGRDNYNNNIIADGTLGGREFAYNPMKASVVHLALDPSGRMLDGKTTYWYADGGVCHETQYRCRRRY